MNLAFARQATVVDDSVVLVRLVRQIVVKELSNALFSRDVDSKHCAFSLSCLHSEGAFYQLH